MKKRIPAKYPGHCLFCGNKITAGDFIYWERGTKPLCDSCGGTKTETAKPNSDSEKATVGNVKLPPSYRRGNERFFTLDWADFKEMLKDAAFNNHISALKNRANVSYATEQFDRAGFSGASRDQIKRWLTEGYKAEAIQGLAEFIPPIREKRRLRFNEESGDLLLDVAWSGGDNYFSEWEKRETIPGVAIEASIMFSAGVPAKTVADYNVWICRTAYSLETAGVDCEITLDFPSASLFREEPSVMHHNIVRLKKENEASDFLSWSPMLSPAALRVFGFSLGAIHADAAGMGITSSFGHGVRDNVSWNVEYDAQRRVIQIKNQYSGYGDFPAESMTNKFRAVLGKIKSQ
jgi:hypothetical protein